VTDSEITTTILRQIRDELVGVRHGVETTNQRLDVTNERLDALAEQAERTNERLDMTNDRLSVVETVLRDVAAQVAFLGRYVKNKQDVAIADLRKRIVRLEKKVG
jgi:chaperonin cofactor prefoldin